jgi:hypothetical protein
MSNNKFERNRGSDLSFSFNWPDGAGGNADLTGYTVAIFEPAAALADYITATITDAATGLIAVRVEWSDTFRTGQLMRFRLQISQGTEQQSTNEMGVIYK